MFSNSPTFTLNYVCPCLRVCRIEDKRKASPKLALSFSTESDCRFALSLMRSFLLHYSPPLSIPFRIPCQPQSEGKQEHIKQEHKHTSIRLRKEDDEEEDEEEGIFAPLVCLSRLEIEVGLSVF